MAMKRKMNGTPLASLSKRLVLALAAGSFLFAGTASASIIVTPNPSDYGTDPALFTVDPESFSPAARNLAENRFLRQTFQMPEPIFVDTIVLSLGVENTASDIIVNFYEVADVNASPIDLSAGVFHSFTFTPENSSDTDRLQLEFTDDDIFSLQQRDSGTEGYAIELGVLDESTNVGPWRHTNDGTDHYTSGAFFTETGGVSGDGDRDTGLSIDGAVIPEPGTYALMAGLAGLAIVMLRRRRA